MKIDIPREVRVIVIEGIAGSGKTTLKGYLKDQFHDRVIHEYTEQELLLGWKHIHVPHVSALRVDFINLILDELERNLAREENSIFILERFHLSMKLLEWEFENNFSERYQKIVERLRKMPVYILIAQLDVPQIRERMHHRERNKQWIDYCEDKLKLRGYNDLELLSIDQQKAFFEAAAGQGIPYCGVHVELNGIFP